MVIGYIDRREAGRVLAECLAEARPGRPLVLALPRGGVPVAYEVASALGAPLDVLVVRKLGVPRQPEVAFGAIASGGALTLDRALVERAGLSQKAVDAVLSRERAELARRERAYRGDRPALDVRARPVILVDDGAATGASMRSALVALRALGPRSVTVAVPVASPQAAEALALEADDFVCPLVPGQFHAVGWWYRDFPQTSDAEVQALLARARADQPMRALQRESTAGRRVLRSN